MRQSTHIKTRRRDARLLGIRFTDEEWRVVEAELARQPYPVPASSLCKTLILRALGAIPAPAARGVHAV